MSPRTRGKELPSNKPTSSTDNPPPTDASKTSATAPTYAAKAATGASADTAPNTDDKSTSHLDPMIDPALASLPPPPHRPASPTTLHSATTSSANGTANGHPGPGDHMSITQSIASAPDPRPQDFTMTQFENNDEIDLETLDAATAEGGPPGSPAQKLMRAIAPANATQVDTKWPAPPPNASVNLFIGRALLSHGNDNWPLKPNDIVNWIRKHYPAEWDGDEGRCSAHRVRTYLARKGADMYYEKLNQGSITGWRIRQNHLWRFENGGFMGRGMKQEEAIAAAQKEHQAIATAAHKAAAAEALVAGHPGIKVSMSSPGVHDGAPPPKRARRNIGQARRKNLPKSKGELDTSIDVSGDQSFYDTSADQSYNFVESSGSGNQPTAAADDSTAGGVIDPTLMSASQNNDEVDMDMVTQAMQAAAAANAGQMDEFDVQLPAEMRMHGDEGDGSGYQDYQGHHPYTPHGDQWGQNQVYGQTGYNGGQ